MHNYSRFEDTSMDTTMYDQRVYFNPIYRNGTQFESTGIIGGGVQDVYFFNRPGTHSFLFGTSLYPYMATPDRTIFYNTRKPFTEISYSNLANTQWGEESLRFLHTQNMDAYSNVGLDLEVLSGRELFTNEDKRVTKFTLFANRTRDKYAAFGTFHFNRFSNYENGGLTNSETFRNTVGSDFIGDTVNLHHATTGYSNVKLFYTQKFVISEKRFYTDTLGVTTDSGTNFSFNHQLVVERNKRYYNEDLSDGYDLDFYDNFYYFHDDVKDSVVQDQIINTFQFILGDPYKDKLSARVYAGHELARYGMTSPEKYTVFTGFDTISHDPLQLDSTFKDTASAVFNNAFSNEVFIGFHLAGPPENNWYWNIDGKYYLLGYYRNNFEANATFSRRIIKKYRLGLRGNIENRNVSYFHNNYSSAFFQWENDFKASQLMRGVAFISSDSGSFEAEAATGLLTNYVYWDENAMPAQYDQVIYLLTAKISSHLHAGAFHSRNQLIFQYTTADDVLRLPLLALKTSNYIQKSFFNKALYAQLGFDLYITTPYTANAYMPATGVFYLQNAQTVGGYPFTDVFLSFRIQRTRLFGSYTNGISLFNSNFFTIADYPMRPSIFRIGVSWTFYD